MKQLWQNIVVASFTVLLTAILGIAAFTYEKIDSIDKRLVRIETAVKFNHPTGASNAVIWKSVFSPSRGYREALAGNFDRSDKAF